MTKGKYIAAAQAAAGRLFRAYESHCLEPSQDTLFACLTALHSLNDRLKKATGRDLHEIEEFIALKVIRNFAHHEEEVRSNVRVIPTPAYSDLLFMCIVRRDQVEGAIENVHPRRKDQSRAACEACFNWYGQAVNINPSIFNVVVRAYELLVTLEVSLPEEDVAALRVSYAAEEEEGRSHYVDGHLIAQAGEIKGILSQVTAELPGV